jgi:hypothetical protein
MLCIAGRTMLCIAGRTMLCIAGRTMLRIPLGNAHPVRVCYAALHLKLHCIAQN